MVMHVPVKLGVLTITFERKSKRFIYQQGNAMYSTYAAQLVSLFLLHPLKLKDSHCGEHDILPSIPASAIIIFCSSDIFLSKQSELRAYF